MMREMSWEQFQEWMAFDLVHPIGSKRGDWQAAQVCASVWNSTLATTRSRKRFKPSDFLLEFTEAPTDDTPTSDASPSTPWQHMKFIARMQVALANADEQKKNRRSRGRR